MTARCDCGFTCNLYSYKTKRTQRCIFFLMLTLALLGDNPYLIAQSSSAPAESIENARALMALNQLTQANEMLATIVSRDPHNLTAWEVLGEVQLAQSLNDDAITPSEHVLNLPPDSLRPHDRE